MDESTFKYYINYVAPISASICLGILAILILSFLAYNNFIR